jgi:hypothetical protein
MANLHGRTRLTRNKAVVYLRVGSTALKRVEIFYTFQLSGSWVK